MRSSVRGARTLAVVACVSLVIAGCASRRHAAGTAEAPELPRWVRLVDPMSPEGIASFVGSCAIAADVESGLAEARRDAHLQIQEDALERFLDVYELVQRDLVKRATSTQRFDFRNAGSQIFADEMMAGARREETYYRRCGEPGEVAASAPVCQVFVLVTVDMVDWDRRVVSLLEELRDRFAGASDTTLAAIADQAIHEYESKVLFKEKGDGARDKPARPPRGR